MRTTNCIERLNGEIRRREYVICIFPKEEAAIRLLGAYLIEHNNNWIAESKSYLNPKFIAELVSEQMLPVFQDLVREDILGLARKIDKIASPDVLFSDYMLEWLESHKRKVRGSTYYSYFTIVKNNIVPYFAERETTLLKLRQQDINAYYEHLYVRGCGGSSIRKHHANIRKALDTAFKNDLIDCNPADKVTLPKVEKFTPNFYDGAELNELFDLLIQKDHWLRDITMMTAFYGLRRSEVLGLKWKAIDFENNRISVEHVIVVGMNEENERVLLMDDDTKSTASNRSLPIMPEVKKLLLERKESQDLQRRVCGNAYSKKHEEYIFIDEIGLLINPNRVTNSHKRFLEQNELKHIRFHDLRHSCASLLLNNGVSLKEIQAWLGHSDFATTANIYAHLSEEKKDAQGSLLSDLLHVR